MFSFLEILKSLLIQDGRSRSPVYIHSLSRLYFKDSERLVKCANPQQWGEYKGATAGERFQQFSGRWKLGS